MRRLLVLLSLAVMCTACSEVQETANSVRGAADTASKAADCAKLATDVAQLQLDRVNDPNAVGNAAQQLEEKVRGIDDRQLRDAAGGLADSAKAYAAAVARGDTTQIARTRTRVEQQARTTAERCGVDVNSFLN